ncbi:MAG: hypothetical protein WKF61_02855, partial [Luteimonas sp.]
SCADGSVHPHARVGHRQVLSRKPVQQWTGFLLFFNHIRVGGRKLETPTKECDMTSSPKQFVLYKDTKGEFRGIALLVTR